MVSYPAIRAAADTLWCRPKRCRRGLADDAGAHSFCAFQVLARPTGWASERAEFLCRVSGGVFHAGDLAHAIREARRRVAWRVLS